MKVVLLGIGGVGGFIGGVLAKQYGDIYFYARGDNLSAIRREGIHIDSSQFGHFTVRPKLATDNAKDIGIADLLFITCKSYDAKEACQQAAAMVGPDTAVIPLLNGLVLSEMMAPLLPPCVLIDGLIYIFCSLQKPGYVLHETGGRIILGTQNGGCPPILGEAVDLLSAAGIPTVISDDIVLDSWKKYVMLCGISTAFCWFDAPPGAIKQQPGYEEIFRSILGELVSVASAKAITLPEKTIDSCLTFFLGLSPDTVTSLYRDIHSGKPAKKTELFHLVGKMVQMGEETGIPTPYHRAVLDRFS